jgi:hypothetical protein
MLNNQELPVVRPGSKRPRSKYLPRCGLQWRRGTGEQSHEPDAPQSARLLWLALAMGTLLTFRAEKCTLLYICEGREKHENRDVH